MANKGEIVDDYPRHSKTQRIILVICAVILVIYNLLAYFSLHGAYWELATIPTVLAAIIILFIYIGRAPELITYIVVTVSVAAAVIASGIILYYLSLLSALAGA